MGNGAPRRALERSIGRAGARGVKPPSQRKIGKLLKGDEPDTNAAAKLVLHHFQRGKLPYFTLPPFDQRAVWSAPR